MDLSRATCAARPPGTSSCPVLPASRRRLHLPGLPLPGEAAAPRAQEFRADSPAGNSATDASPAWASAARTAGAEVPAQLGAGWGQGCQALYLMHTRVHGCDQWWHRCAHTANTTWAARKGRPGASQ